MEVVEKELIVETVSKLSAEYLVKKFLIVATINEDEAENGGGNDVR